MKKITPFLWFNGQAEEAMKFYCSVFKKSKKGKVTRWGAGSPAPKGSVMSASFTLEGQDFIAFNGGPHFSFTPAISIFVDCKDQKEVDRLWSKLSAGGQEMPCGWLSDKFGLTWQIIPSILGKVINDKNPKKAERAMKAMMQMKKIDIKALQAAHAGK
jgi:predicted 3-demethylubiquinone-9 3-methyltransferase (glyoxalase superfamily)